MLGRVPKRPKFREEPHPLDLPQCGNCGYQGEMEVWAETDFGPPMVETRFVECPECGYSLHD